jgi:RNA polymerase sigma-54 factor
MLYPDVSAGPTRHGCCVDSPGRADPARATQQEEEAVPSLEMRADHRQTQSLSPRLQHAVRLLQMSSLDFAALVRDALGSNPFLETEEGEGEGIDGPEPGQDEPGLQQAHDGDTLAAASEAAYDDVENDRDLWHADGGSGLRRAEDGELSAMELMAVETSLNTHLHGQLNVLPLSPRDLALARTIVESLDDDGYLRTPLEELLEVAGLDPAASLHEMQIALKRVQSLEPAGVAARSVAECLRLQLPAIDCPKMRGIAQTIVDQHLQALAARDVVSMARQLGASPAYVEQVCDRIRRLDPRPGWRLGSSQVAYVVPDVVVKKVRGQWSVQLNPAIVPRVRLNQVYAQLFQRHRSAQNAEMGAHLQEARWTLRNVEQRFSTILDVATAIVKRQRNFLDYGPMAMKPMGLREIADEVGVHESTVSRVTNNKYMATPNGVFELKYFFSRAMVSANGSACSGTAIRGLIKDVIEAENPDAPLSDAEITRQLAQQGLIVARRTVTKYRQMLKIEAVDRRRRHS